MVTALRIGAIPPPPAEPGPDAHVDAGCRTFDPLTQGPDPSMIPGAVGEVRRLLATA